MAKKQDKKPTEAKASTEQVVIANGTVVESKVVTGKKTRLSHKEQGQLARGEIDESLEPTGKEMKRKRDGASVIKDTETLYQGELSAEAVSANTGEPISWRWKQEMPTTEEGCYRVMENAFGPGMVKRDSFKLDPTNSIDPTLRTSLEK